MSHKPKQPKPTKEEVELQVQRKAHKARLRKLREEDTCPEYDEIIDQERYLDETGDDYYEGKE